MASHEEIIKGLETIDNPLVRQTIEYLINKVDNADDDGDYEVAKAAFLMYVHAAAPNLLKEDVNVAGALGYDELEAQAAEEVESIEQEPTVDAEAVLKSQLAANGIYYFGPMNMDKHLKTGPQGSGYTLPHPPHGQRQESHGNRPGKREMIGYLADAKEVDPTLKDKIPRRVDMLQMKHKDVVDLATKVLGHVTTSGAQNVIDAQPDSTGVSGSTVTNTPDPDATVLPGAGAGQNTTQQDRAATLQALLRRRKG